MSFKSMFQDMKNEFGSISRKGFRSRSHRVVQDCTVTLDASRQSCWNNMPLELLRDVLMRIEASDSDWRPRKNVVTCADVCRSWGEIMKEIVKTPEICGKLTFPISLKQLWSIHFKKVKIGSNWEDVSRLYILSLFSRVLFYFGSNLLSRGGATVLCGVTIWWSGLMRGAVSMILAYNQFTKSGLTQVSGNALIFTSTIVIVLFSTVVFGLLTKPLIRYVLPQSQHFINSSMSSYKFSFVIPLLNELEDDEGDVPRKSSLTMLLKRPAQAIQYFWREFDDAFMLSVFGGRESMLHTPLLAHRIRTYHSFESKL